MATPYLGEIRWFAFDFPARGWARADGQVLSINQNLGLYALLNATFGGNGTTTFALPNLKGRTIRGAPSVGAVGGALGTVTHTLQTSELPPHTHQAYGTTQAAVASSADTNRFATAAAPAYASTGTTQVAADTVTMVGSGVAHENLQPYAVLQACIALQGVFPSST